MKKILLKTKTAVDSILIPWLSKSRIGSNLYYLIFSSQFSREHKAVLSGKAKHIREAKYSKTNRFTLIRNTHRIEKGLLMKPRKDVFATEFIEETVDNFEGLWNLNKCGLDENDKQGKWFVDVLTEYFNVTGDHPKVNRQRERFAIIINKKRNDSLEKSIPYFRSLKDKPVIRYEEFYKLTKFRRSVRWFLQKKVPHNLVDKAILAAAQSPSACNRQPFEYRIIDDPELLKKAVKLPMGVKGYSDHIPMLVVVVGNLDAYFDERDRHIIYIDASLSNMTFMLALETLGLSSCPINWPDIEKLERRMERLLGLLPYQRPIMCIAVGYPDPRGLVGFSEKRDLLNIRKYN